MRFLVLFILCFLLAACDGGLAPPPMAEPGFSGTVYFTPDSWPKDSLFSLWIFASQVYPLDSEKVYNGLLGSKTTIFLYPSISQSLPLIEADSMLYSFPLQPGMYRYVGVIQHVSPDFSIRAFRVVGFYKDLVNPLQPGVVEVNDTSTVKGININVDFNNPPVQPF
jgi:hypothetical protein